VSRARRIPRKRVEAVAKLHDAGIECGVLIAPVLPGLSDAPEQVEEVARACLEAGAGSISALVLHLRPGVREHFMTWLAQAYPDLVPEYERRYKGRAYLPKAEQARVSSVVTRVLEEMRPPQPVHVFGRGHTGHERGDGPSPRQRVDEVAPQLGLFD
jgi:DNA repair photolyase